MPQEPTGRFSGEAFLQASQRFRRPVEAEEPAPRPRKMTRLAIVLAVATVLSTFWAGVGAWDPLQLLTACFELDSYMPLRQAVLANWAAGLQFALALMAILVAHELGHYVLTLVYGVPSTPPLFIPFPFISPIGTMGAVILMQSGAADRKQIFDIGLAGPLAGLIVAFPITVYGLLNATPIEFATSSGAMYLGQPLLIQWLASVLVPEEAGRFIQVANTEASPFLMAGWVGLLVTGLNMMPLGQLDGGHVAFGLLGPKSVWIARATLVGAIAFMVVSQVIIFSLMLLLVVLMGLKHPPSSDDSRALGLPRQIIGWVSLILPVLCIPAHPLQIAPM